MSPSSRCGTQFGNYEIGELLGEGGMGAVYEAHDTVKGRVVALKILASHLSNEDAFRERFRRESRTAARLQEPHVIPIHDWGEIDGALFIDMRLVRGEDLRTLLKRGPLDPSRAVAINGQIASALEAAHAEGLIHRDVKPENIIVTPADFAYLVDFGIAEADGDTRLTATGSAIGSFAYMAPERFTGQPATPAADIYALACVLHETLTGTAPYPGNSFQHVIAGHVSTPPPRPSAVNSAVPCAFDEVIARAMAKEPDDRYGSAGAFGRAAQRALQPPRDVSDPNATLSAHPVPPPTRVQTYPPQSESQVWGPSLLHRLQGPGEKRQAWLIPSLFAAALVAIVFAIGIAALLIQGQGNGPVQDTGTAVNLPAGQAPSVGNPAAPEPPSVEPQMATLPPGARVCPPSYGPSGPYSKSAVGTTVTSCPFAEEVRIAYGASGPPSALARVVHAFSPVTGKSYPMTCAANGALVTCTGGEDAIVYVY